MACSTGDCIGQWCLTVNERMPAPSGPAPVATATVDTAESKGASLDLTRVSSRQVSWWEVHEFVAPMLASGDPYPVAGTPAWCLLPAGDVRKVLALFDAARHWALRVETYQTAMAEASRAVASSTDWSAVQRGRRRHDKAVADGAYIPRVTS